MSSYKSPKPRQGIENLPPYVPGKSEAGAARGPLYKLSANESPLGASPKAMAAYEKAVKDLALYPEAGADALRAALAEVHGLDAARIVIGAGSDELLHLLAEAYLSAGDEAVISEFAFLMYPIATLAAGGEVVVAKDRDFTVDVDAMLAAVTDKTRIVWLANPNNPTGTYLNADEVRRLHAGLRSDIILVIDNAYGEYVTAPDYETGASLVETADNVVMLRTFSKMGLAALRVGWLYGPPAIVDVINRLRSPFNVSRPAQAAAEAAARDVGFTARLRAHNGQWRDWLVETLSSNRIKVLPSQGNFILALFADTDEAAKGFVALAEAGAIVREMGAYGLPHALRISIGSEEAMRLVAETMAEMMGTGS